MPETAWFGHVETEAKKLLTAGKKFGCEMVTIFPETSPMSQLSSFQPPPHSSFKDSALGITFMLGKSLLKLYCNFSHQAILGISQVVI